MRENQIEEATALASGITRNITAVDTSPWMVVQYVPDLGTGATSASIAYIVASSMTFLVDSAVPAGKDAIGTSGVILTSQATFDTMGELVDGINGYIAWRAYLVGALRSDLSSLMLAKSATICTGTGTENGLTFYSDTSAAYSISTAISGERFVGYGINDWEKDWDDKVRNQLLQASINVTYASNATGMAQGLKYYTGKAGETETQLGGGVALVTATAKLQGEANLTEPWEEATLGHRLIIRIANASAGALSAPACNIVGKSIPYSNDRIVTSKNYS